jgi:hypothetical protein
MIEWSDIYAGTDVYDYPQEGIDRNSYSSQVQVPASYAG